jgi:16S rRNA (cytosine967-C5)-methyltransferase
MISPARVAAYHIQSAISAGRDLPAAIAAARDRLADDRDRALAAEIATGVQRWRAALDHLIVHFSGRTLDRLDPEIVDILRLSAYQLLHLTRVPSAAVVDDAVDLARRAGKGSAAGFVNAVLRAISRSRKALPLPGRPETGARRDAVLTYFSITLSHPRWLARRWLDRLGFEAAETWLQFNNQPAPVTLRANRLRTTRRELGHAFAAEGIETHDARFAPDALVVDTGSPFRSSFVDEGRFLVQDEASQLVGLLATPRSGWRVLDACASPGGKTSAIAAAMAGRGLLVACDVRDRRIDLLRRTLGAMGAMRVHVVQADLLQHLPFRISFDLVVVDAPCSGLGTLRRDPDIRWRRDESELAGFASAELRMLQSAAEVVAPGGRLVYATCSSEPDENEDVAHAFLAGTSGFTLVHARAAVPELPIDVVDSRGYLRTEPHRHRLEAFFGAVFERRPTASEEL